MCQERGVVHKVNFRGYEAERVYFDPVANTTCWHRIKMSKTVRNNRNLQIFPKKWRMVMYEFLGGETMDENLYFLDVTSLRTHLYDLWYEYKHNTFQNYYEGDPLYEVNQETWERNLRRLDALVATYGFDNYSIDIAFAFKTLGVKPNSVNKYMYWTIGQRTAKAQQDCDVWDAFQSIILPNLSQPFLTKGRNQGEFLLGFSMVPNLNSQD
jgi:hypothetical protein